MWQLIVGAVTGFLGPIVSQYFDLQKEKLKAEERAKDRSHELSVIDKEGEWAAKKMTVEGEIRAEVAAQQSFTASYQFANDNLIPEGAKLSSRQMSLVVFVEVLSKAIRPVTTIFFNVATVAIYVWLAYQVMKTGQAFASSVEARAIFREITYSLFGLAETVTLWWYGIRKMSQKRI